VLWEGALVSLPETTPEYKTSHEAAQRHTDVVHALGTSFIASLGATATWLAVTAHHQESAIRLPLAGFVALLFAALHFANYRNAREHSTVLEVMVLSLMLRRRGRALMVPSC
jgi:hypothetical protein